jgi:SAM-dependent methyltransferase
VRFYAEVVFPRLCDLLLGRPSVARHRRDLLATAHGDVLEIGFGSGLNLPHYPDAVRRLTAVDPNPGMRRLAERRVRRSRIAVDRHVAAAERLPFADDRFDCAVSTFTLCSVASPGLILREVYRVLKPGGRLLLLEHGLSPDPAVRRWQRRLNWLEVRLADGCHLDRDVRGLLTGCPFSAVEVDEFYLPGMPRTHGYLYRGRAVK